mmetsp:Transcript_16470/g.49328  ORF Transcript_16470/g.49328 Transcript_16470/m.49328 type:complete len:204 (-) Transcript_16470:1510-2121(-)
MRSTSGTCSSKNQYPLRTHRHISDQVITPHFAAVHTSENYPDEMHGAQLGLSPSFPRGEGQDHQLQPSPRSRIFKPASQSMRASCTARAVSFRNLRANRGHLYFRLRWLHRLLDRQDRELTSSALAKDPSPRLIASSALQAPQSRRLPKYTSARSLLKRAGLTWRGWYSRGCFAPGRVQFAVTRPPRQSVSSSSPWKASSDGM